MPIETKLAAQFAPQIRTRGIEYFRARRVSVLDLDENLLYATVSGSRDYEVILELDPQSHVLLASCECPHFADGNPCKHVWAAILAADDLGVFQAADPLPDLTLVADNSMFEDKDFDEEDDDDPFGGDEIDALTALFDSNTFPPDLSGILRNYRQTLQQAPKQPGKPGWRDVLERIKTHTAEFAAHEQAHSPVQGDLHYVLDVAKTMAGDGTPILKLHQQWITAKGTPSKLQGVTLRAIQVPSLCDPADREIVTALLGGHQETQYYAYSQQAKGTFVLHPQLMAMLLPQLGATGRFYIRPAEAGDPLGPLRFDDGPPWELWLQVRAAGKKKQYRVEGQLRREDKQLPLSDPIVMFAYGWVFWADRFARLDHHGAFAWIANLRREGQLDVPRKAGRVLVASILDTPRYPRLDLPPELQYQEKRPTPKPLLDVTAAQNDRRVRSRLWARLSFDYDGAILSYDEERAGIFRPDPPSLLVRDREAEAAAAAQLASHGFRNLAGNWGSNMQFEFKAATLPRVVAELAPQGWHIQAEGKPYRPPGKSNVRVSSGIDWFELQADVDYDGMPVALPELLAALKRGENMITLDDGSLGMIPEQWLEKFGKIARMGKVEGDRLKFKPSQAALLDALLASQPEATCDAAFKRIRRELNRFTSLAPADPAPSFEGVLRHYQSDGLGWLLFLRRFGLGGCLADDMGLGKTIQILALLDRLCPPSSPAPDPSASHSSPAPLAEAASLPASPSPLGGEGRGEGAITAPTLIIVPRSLVHNWAIEAARFTPRLRVLDNTGPDRTTDPAVLAEYDIVLSTYGTLRRDIPALKDVPFEYAILDEAQAIKNASTATAKAARLLHAQHRLALSGTPIENHLGELWSLFEFLNPGMLGSAKVFRAVYNTGQNPDDEARALLARALRPFILRRTKRQVARDLPEKQEDTLYCELDQHERRHYDELRLHYRQVMLEGKTDAELADSKMEILTALLRLRQAACHLGLVDKRKTGRGSAKLDCLFPQIEELIDEGHKALVFSQFTSLLGIVRERLRKKKIVHEYLDGRTRDRQARVERFQTDPNCPIFLISLKAGGLGLNLTAAEYVFLLDPWWNPAVEAQAIDRTHRIGQTRSVFAYRIIARDTVEEKVLQLQQTKRELADSILGPDNRPLHSLTRNDLELLLS